MTFTYKLSRRLAGYWGVAALVLAAGACAPGEPLSPSAPLAPPPVTPRADTTLAIRPSSADIETNAPLQFRAYEKRGPTDSVLIQDVDWVASGGTIDSTGLYHSPVEGSFLVVSRRRGYNWLDTARVRVARTAATLVRVDVLPATAQLQPGQTQAFTATGTTAGGTTAPVTVSWSSTGGTISSAGAYTASSVPGTYRVIAVQSGGTLADTSIVTVAAAPASLVAVEVSPATATVAAAGTRQLAAVGRLSDGSAGTVAVTWTAEGGGSISSGGLYTAGTTAGTARAIARQASGTLADTSLITVTAAPPPPATLATVSVVPAAVSLVTSGTQQFTVSGTNTDGTSASPAVTWSATGGSVSGAGLYTAGTATGSFRVIATATDGKADTSAVTITAPAPTQVGVAVSPATATLLAGATQQFSAAAQLSNGTTGPTTVTWTGTGGSISAAGVYTAGSTAGSFSVIGRSTTTGFADTSAVTVTVPAPTAVSVVLSPATVSLTTGGMQAFTSTTQFSNGTTAAATVSYAVTGGTMAGSTYTAGGTAGSFRVIATLSGSTLADTSVVTISAPAPLTPSAVVLTPASVTLTSGSTQAFSATVQYTNGTSAAASVGYTATGGTMTGATYTAGATPGTYRVIATLSGSTLADTSAMVVTAPSGTGGSGSTSGAGPNEPAGYTTVSSNPFDALPADNPTVDSYGYTKYYGNSNLSIVADATTPASAPNYLRLLFPQGQPGGAAPNSFSAATSSAIVGNRTRMYTRIRFRVSSNWTDNGNTGTKFFFFGTGNRLNNHYVNLTQGGNLQLAVNLQSTFGYSQPSGPNHFIAGTLTKGVWHDAEILLIGNTPGQYNGVARIWVDGAQLLNVTDMGYFGPGEVARWDIGYWFSPTYGGGANAVPANQTLDLDHWYLSVAP